MNPLYQRGTLWFFNCPVQGVPIGPFTNETTAGRARAYHYASIKPTLNPALELDIIEPTVVR